MEEADGQAPLSQAKQPPITVPSRHAIWSCGPCQLCWRRKLTCMPEARSTSAGKMPGLPHRLEAWATTEGNDRKIRGRKMSRLKSKVQMTNDKISPNDECRNGSSTDACRSGRGLELVIRHSSFGFWPSPVPRFLCLRPGLRHPSFGLSTLPRSPVSTRGFVAQVLESRPPNRLGFGFSQ